MKNIKYRPTVTIVIKCLNEADCLKRLLPLLKMQDYPTDLVEIIVLDNDSTDNSREIAKSFGARVVIIPRDEFTYPKATNIGCQQAAGELVAFLSAHSYPLNKKWLSKGVRHFADQKVAGIFAHVLPYINSTWAERFYYLLGTSLYRCRWFIPAWSAKGNVGLMGFTNAIIRRKLWEKYPFDETMENGGEDTIWSQQRLAEGYKIICEPYFAVRHAHYLNRKQLKQQIELWQSFSKHPGQKFSRSKLTSFRSGAKRYLD